jgi:UDP-glucose 4-epimerase
VRIAITGSRGFVGGSFGRYAAARGHEVLGISRSAQPDLDWPGAHAHVDCANGDLANAFRNFRPDVVFHAAGSASVPASLAAPMEDMRALVMTLGNTLDGIRRAGISPLLMLPSSAAVYGNPEELPMTEAARIAPISPFGYHKAMCETLAQESAAWMGLRVVICRIFSLYGPRQRRLLIWEIYKQLVSDRPLVELEGTGSETRDWLHIDDACDAFLALIGRPTPHPQRGVTIANVASGTELSVSQVYEEIKHLIDKEKMLMCHGVQRPGDPRHWVADVSNLRELAPNWRPRPLKEGLAETIAAWGGA